MLKYDKVIKGGTVIDGRFLPRRIADVAIKDGRIASIGRINASDGAEVIDASGLIVAPGFVDLHTHYDSAFFYDPYCTISGWHGTTSVAIGNCGFGFAPARPDDRDYLMKTLTRVEAIDYGVMKETLPWSWETFPEWMDALDATPKGVNALTYVPLNPLLVYVMGLEAAKSRDATESERAELAALLRQAMDAGACGWSAQRTRPGTGFDVQRDFDGSPFATDLLSNETALVLGKVLADYEHAFIQTVLLSELDSDADRKHIEELARVSDSSVLYNAIVFDHRWPTMHKETLDWIASCQARGLKIYAQCISMAETLFTATIADGWNNFDESTAWREATIGTPAEMLEKFKDPAVRAALKADPPTLFPLENMIILRTETQRFMPAKGTLLPDGAKACGYDDPVEFFIDMVVSDELKTLFQIPNLNYNPDKVAAAAAVKDIVTQPFSLYGTSDGGAHQKFLTSSYTTQAIVDLVRDRELITLEECHYRLSNLPAYCAGFKDRGTLVEGAAADIVIYDYEKLTLLPSEVAYDLPCGDWRRVQHADGYYYTIVNGTSTFIEGKCTEETPGRLLRFGAG